LLIKTDEEGKTIWNKTYGGTNADEGYCVEETIDGGYIITGWTYSYDFGRALWLVKTDENGNKEWDKIYDRSSWDWGTWVEQTADGGYIITGITSVTGSGPNDDVWLIKTDENGSEEWNKLYGGKDWEEGYCVKHTMDGGYIITGVTNSYGSGGVDLLLIKTDEDGNSIWGKTFGGTEEDYGYCVRQTPDGGYIITGKTESYGAGDSDVWLIKVQADGGSIGSDFPIDDNTGISGFYLAAIFIIFCFSIVLILTFLSSPTKQDITSRIVKKTYFTLPCPNCGAAIKMSATSCKKCGEKFQICIICKLSILKDHTKTPCCQAYAHRSHLKEWLKIKGKCPNCGEKLEEWEIS